MRISGRMLCELPAECRRIHNKGGNHRTIHLSVADKAKDIIADGRAAQSKFCEIIFAGFSREEVEMLQQFTEQVNRNIKEYMNS